MIRSLMFTFRHHSTAARLTVEVPLSPTLTMIRAEEMAKDILAGMVLAPHEWSGPE